MAAMTGASDPLAGSGGAHVWIFAGLAVSVIIGLLWWRRRHPTRGVLAGDLTPLDVALLAGGSDRAVAASLAALRVAGAVRVVGGVLRRDGVPHEAAAELDLAVYQAVGGAHSPQSMSVDPRVRELIGGAGAALVDAGLLRGTRERRRLRAATVPVFLVALLGLVAGLRASSVVLLAIAALTAAAGVVLLRVGLLPARTRAALSREREEAAFLAPSASPDWTLHGPQVAGLAVAMFGLAHLHRIDPDLHELCVRPHDRPVPLEGTGRRDRQRDVYRRRGRSTSSASNSGYGTQVGDGGWGGSDSGWDGGGGGGDGGGFSGGGGGGDGGGFSGGGGDGGGY